MSAVTAGDWHCLFMFRGSLECVKRRLGRGKRRNVDRKKARRK